MKNVLFGVSLILVLASAAQGAKPTYTWNKKEVEALKGKTLYSAYCVKLEGFFTKEACTLGIRDLSFKKFKLKTLEWVNPSTIRVGDSLRSIEITRGPSMAAFIMNGKTIDFNTSTSAEIRKKITSALPKVGASFFMNAAYAEEPEANVFAELNRAVYVLMSQTTDEEVCKSSQQIANLCQDGKYIPGADTLISSLQNYSAQKNPLDKGRAAKKVLSSINNLKTVLDASSDLIDRAYYHARAYSCSLDYRGNRWRPVDVFRECNILLKTQQDQLEEGLEKMGVNAAAKYADDEELSQKLIEVRQKMPSAQGGSFSPQENDLLKDSQKPRGVN